MAKQDLNVNGETKEIKVINLTKEDLLKEHETLSGSYNEVVKKLDEITVQRFKLEGALINLQELIKKFE